MKNRYHTRWRIFVTTTVILRPLLFIFFNISVISSNAQIGSLFKGIDEVEIIAGPSLVSFHGIESNEFRKIKAGHDFEFGVAWNLNKQIDLTVELSYQRKGTRTRYQIWYYDPTLDSNNCNCTTSLGKTENNINLNYLSLATTVRFQFMESNFYFSIGPFVSYLIKAQNITENSWTENKQYNDISYVFIKIDGGISASIDYQVEVKQDIFFNIQIRENYGLLNINNNRIVDGISRTNAISFQLGFTYQLH